jgi:hypothetical protein
MTIYERILFSTKGTALGFKTLVLTNFSNKFFACIDPHVLTFKPVNSTCKLSKEILFE